METDENEGTRALVIHPDIGKSGVGRDTTHALEEAVSLAAALPGLELLGADIVRLAKPHPGTLFGKGKIEEIGTRIKAEEIELVLVDGPVSPVQQRNLELAWKVKLLDRTGLILEIFSDRAATREGVLQVEMAALSYQRTRLVRAWTHLERQRGGLGFVGGPGETQIEADRRAIDDQLVRLKRQLDKVIKTRALHRAAREKVPYPIVALVGYTNAGKSTIFNRLTGAKVLAKDMLFATLDPTMRALKLPSGREVILSDTVGFISSLPTELVAAFRATLEEVLAADVVVHVRDITHPETEQQKTDVLAILEELGVGEDRTMIEVWNKADLLANDAREPVETAAARLEGTVVSSAMSDAGLQAVIDEIETALDQGRRKDTMVLGHDEGKKRAWLYEQGVVTGETETEAGTEVDVTWSETQAVRFSRL